MPNLTDPSSQQLLLALDVGTLSVRAAAYDQTGNPVALVSQPVALKRLSETQVEQSPQELRSGLQLVLDDLLKLPEVSGKEIVAAGLTTQRSSVVAWDRKTGEPLSPILSWQDRRAPEYLDPLKSKGTDIKKTSGLFLSPHYGASKLRWLLDHCPDLADNPNMIFGPLAAFMAFSILDDHACIVDHVNASRTLLMDLTTRDWSAMLLSEFDLDQRLLPTCQPTQSAFGTLCNGSIPLTAVNGDQNAAIHGAGAVDEETCIVNVGTGAFVLLPTGNRPISHPRLLASVANSTADNATYLLEGTVNSAGAALNWAQDEWGIDDLIEYLPAWMEQEADLPIFINTIGGLGSPHWTDGPPAHFIGEGSIPQKAVAVVESILFLIQINLEAMRNTGQVFKRIRISGGLAALDPLCQLLADLSQRAVVRPEETQSTARGIAWLASGQSKSWQNQTEDHFLPRSNKPLHARYRKFCAQLGWN